MLDPTVRSVKADTPDRDRLWLMWIALGAVIIRLISLAFAQIGTVDENAFEYGRIARFILAGAGHAYDFWGDYPVAPTASMAPLYSYLLAAYTWIFGPGLWGMAVLQALAGGVCCWAIGKIGTQLSGRTVGLTAAGIFAVYPELIFMPQKFVAEPWLLLFTLLFLFYGILYWRRGKRIYLIAAAVWVALSALTKESALLYPLFFLVWVCLTKKPSRRLWVDSALFLLVVACVIAPWSLRNYSVFGRLVIIRTGFWYNAWRGNHPGATGTARGFQGTSVDQLLDVEYLDQINARVVGDELERDRIYRDLTLEFIREDPSRFLNLTVKRLIYLWSRDPTHPATRSVLYWGPWILLLAMAIFGMGIVRQRWRDYSFWYLVFLSATALYSLTMVLPRYRLPLLPGLILLAAEGIVGMVSRSLTLRKKAAEA